MVLKQGPGFGAAVAAALEGAFAAAEGPVHGARTHGPQLPSEGGGDRHPTHGPGQPQREEGFEAHRPGVAGGLPDRREERLHVGLILPGSAALGGAAPRGGVEGPDGRLPIVVGGGAKLVEDLVFTGPCSGPVAGAQGLEVVAHRGWGHRSPSLGGGFGSVTPFLTR